MTTSQSGAIAVVDAAAVVDACAAASATSAQQGRQAPPRVTRTPTQNRSRWSNNLLPRRTSPRLKRPQDPNENFDEEDDEEPGESQPLLSPAPFNDVVIPADHDRVVESQLTIDGLLGGDTDTADAPPHQ